MQIIKTSQMIQMEAQLDIWDINVPFLADSKNSNIYTPTKGILQIEVIMSQCTMALAIEIKERKICKSKWLDFTHFPANYYFFGLYCCETANI